MQGGALGLAVFQSTGVGASADYKDTTGVLDRNKRCDDLAGASEK